MAWPCLCLCPSSAVEVLAKRAEAAGLLWAGSVSLCPELVFVSVVVVG